MSKKRLKVPVSERAVLQRLNRSLAGEGVVIRTCRDDSRWFNDTGRHYAVNVNRNSIEEQHVDIEAWAREDGVLKPFEVMVSV